MLSCGPGVGAKATGPVLLKFVGLHNFDPKYKIGTNLVKTSYVVWMQELAIDMQTFSKTTFLGSVDPN